jgi:CHAT domain-containing protein/tetratricopeptide (TPR) repeat protein
MDAVELARQLVTANARSRRALLRRQAALPGLDVAEALKAEFDTARAGDPPRALAAATALSILARVRPQPQVAALALWTAGRAALQIEGRIEQAAADLQAAEAQFAALGLPRQVAATQVSTLHALALLGRYDEALECGQRARDVFLAHGDLLSTGKIEQNLGNLYFRRDRYPEALDSYHAARERFAAVGDLAELARADNNLGNVLAAQYRFTEATQHYEAALRSAEDAGLAVTQAEIECNLGDLALYQGRYDRALDYLERSRRRYAALGIPHRAAITEQDLADTYLELNLAPEAAAIYARVIPLFAERDMRAERARALANQGIALSLLEQRAAARAALDEARDLYTAEENVVGLALVTLAAAHLHFGDGDFLVAAQLAADADAEFLAAGMTGRRFLARWLHGEAMREAGQFAAAQASLEETLRDADDQAVPQIAQRCLTSLGLLGLAAGDADAAEQAFTRSIALIEALRAPLPAEEFRAAFVADKLRPYSELVRLCLAPGAERVDEAFGYVERARSRALIDLLRGAFPADPSGKPRDEFEAALLARLADLRANLNGLYAQINRPPTGEPSRGAARQVALQESVSTGEAAVLELMRQLQQRGGSPFGQVDPVALPHLRAHLGRDTALISYFSLDGELLAFVLTDQGVSVVRHLGNEAEAEAAATQLRLQLGTLRHGSGHLRAHAAQLTRRAQRHLARLYDLLIRPLEPALGTRRLAIVPHRALHYIPFHALYDGASYLIEQREVCYAPSASVLAHCLDLPARPGRRALLFGVPDARTPRIRDEIAAVAQRFPEATTALDEAGTLALLREQAGAADILHLACHGHFRPDNPLFSSLQLADGWLTVRDAAALDLRCGLVTLSACETGISQVAPGDELIGLARGFFAAGASALVVSLWTVDDASTAQLMAEFYAHVAGGVGLAAALRRAQCSLLAEYPHPFFWSPFVLLGRW